MSTAPTARTPVLNVMIRAAERAAESLRRDLAHPDLLNVREKAASDFVSNADLRAQEIARGELLGAYPGYALLLEEEDVHASATGAPRFIVDPLDGTTNFVRGIPHFCVSIALEEAGEVTAGVTADVTKGEVFWALEGGGAWLGERRLGTSRERDLTRTVIGTGIPHHGRGNHPRYLESLGRVMHDVAGIRRLGSAALDMAYVAAGRFDAFFETGLAPWDVAVGGLLVREAGGVVTTPGGRVAHLSGDVLAASCAEIHAAMLDRIRPLGETFP